jgi:hypothetical protein
MITENHEKEIGQAASFLSPNGGLTFIEQLQNCSMGKCSKDTRPYLIGVNEENRVAILTRPDCKMWNCEACAARNARRWIARIINGCNKLGGEWFFLTLTAAPQNRKYKSVDNLRDGWDRVYTCINALFSRDGETPHYSRIWEQHEDGSFHLHAMLDVVMSKRWIKDTAFAAGLGHQADWRKIDNAGQAAGYMAKYTLKNATIARGGVQWPKGLRRIETSRNWPKLPDLRVSEQWEWIIKMTRDEQLQSAGRINTRGFEILDQTGEKEV